MLHDLLAWDGERGVWFEDPGHMYKLARGWDMVPDDCDDPCESIPMNPKRRRERFLTDAEFTRFGQVLDEVSGNGSQVSAGAVTTIRLLMLTGCGKSEIGIVDGKTGSRTVHLPPSTAGVLKALPRQPDNPWVVPGAKPGKHMTDIDGAWQSIRARAGFHDIRHSCASLPYSLAA